MKQSLLDIERQAAAALVHHGCAAISGEVAADCAWLEGVGYPGLKLLAEALGDEQRSLVLERDALGLDLKNVSCAFISRGINAMLKTEGRLFLRNVRHGLYLVPESVRHNYAIGCPVDPAFALGGERTKNPYAEKLEAAARDGVEVDDAIWQSLNS